MPRGDEDTVPGASLVFPMLGTVLRWPSPWKVPQEGGGFWGQRVGRHHHLLGLSVTASPRFLAAQSPVVLGVGVGETCHLFSFL